MTDSERLAVLESIIHEALRTGRDAQDTVSELAAKLTMWKDDDRVFAWAEDWSRHGAGWRVFTVDHGLIVQSVTKLGAELLVQTLNDREGLLSCATGACERAILDCLVRITLHGADPAMYRG